jgi:hypothetical protein
MLVLILVYLYKLNKIIPWKMIWSDISQSEYINNLKVRVNVNLSANGNNLFTWVESWDHTVNNMSLVIGFTRFFFIFKWIEAKYMTTNKSCRMWDEFNFIIVYHFRRKKMSILDIRENGKV